MQIFHRCSGQTACSNELTLTGTYNKVVIERINACTDDAVCSNTVHIEDTVKILQLKNSVDTVPILNIKLKNRCDASATCSNTPD